MIPRAHIAPTWANTWNLYYHNTTVFFQLICIQNDARTFISFLLQSNVHYGGDFFRLDVFLNFFLPFFPFAEAGKKVRRAMCFVLVSLPALWLIASGECVCMFRAPFRATHTSTTSNRSHVHTFYTANRGCQTYVVKSCRMLRSLKQKCK